MILSGSDFFVIPTYWPPILAHSWTMYRKKGFFGFWKNLSISIVIPVTGAGVTGAALAVITRIAPDLEMLEVEARWILPGFIGIVGMTTFWAQRVYPHTSSWALKTMIMHLHGASLLLCIPLINRLHARQASTLHPEAFEDLKIVANVIAGVFSFVTSTTAICVGVNPILSNTAGSLAFVSISTVVFGSLNC